MHVLRLTVNHGKPVDLWAFLKIFRTQISRKWMTKSMKRVWKKRREDIFWALQLLHLTHVESICLTSLGSWCVPTAPAVGFTQCHKLSGNDFKSHPWQVIDGLWQNESINIYIYKVSNRPRLHSNSFHLPGPLQGSQAAPHKWNLP